MVGKTCAWRKSIYYINFNKNISMKYILYMICLAFNLTVQANNDIKHVFTDSYSNEKVTAIMQADNSHYYIMAGNRLHSIDLGEDKAADKNVFMVIHLPISRTPWIYLFYALVLAALFRFAVVPYILARKKFASKPINLVKKDSPLSPEQVREEMDRKFVEKVRDLIMDNMLERKVTVEFIYKQLNMSDSAFRKRWSSIDNEPLINFILALKMEKAKELLMSHRYRVGEVADKLGYNDVKHFSRTFKKYHGMCPQKICSVKDEK